MNNDETEIRALVQTWMDATIAGDTQQVLDLMADDAVFSVVGADPFGKQVFADMAQGNPDGMSIKGTNEIVELQVLGDWAFTRNHISIEMSLRGQEPVLRSGYTLTLFRKDGGAWLLARDANMVTTD